VKDQYHHGNLKRDLIENAIQIISEYGFEQLSLRNIAKQCGVSHNAVYRHFESKEQLIDTCRNYVTDLLTEYLRNVVKELEPAVPETLRTLAEAYIHFYQEQPTYYIFLYRNSSVQIILTTQKMDENHPPFEIFREVCCAIAEKQKRSSDECLNHLIQLWSLIHGLTALLISPKVEWNSNWLNCLDNFFEETCT